MQAVNKTFAGIKDTLGNGDAVAVQAAAVQWAPGGQVFNRYAIQVKGEGAGATSWSVTLEGSLDGKNWTTLITHSATDGSTSFLVDKPCIAIRANVGSLSLGSATAIDVSILAAA